MMDSLDKKIIDYCENQLTGSELADFEKALASDLNLQHRVEQQKELMLAIQSSVFQDQIESFLEEKSPRMPARSRVRFRTVRIAIISAAAAIVVAILNPFSWFDSSENSDWNQFFYTDPGLPTPMSEVDAYQFYDGMVDYKMEKYQQALVKWEGPASDIGQDTLSYYRGMAYYNLNRWAEAKKALFDIDENSAFFRKAQWYQLGILIQENRLSEARQLMETFPPDIHPNYDQVRSSLTE